MSRIDDFLNVKVQDGALAQIILDKRKGADAKAEKIIATYKGKEYAKLTTAQKLDLCGILLYRFGVLDEKGIVK
jgi:hypothetical protein